MRKVIKVPKTIGNVIKEKELEDILNQYPDYRIETVLYGQGVGEAHIILIKDKK